MAAPKFKTVKRTAPNGFEYTIQVVDNDDHPTARDDGNDRSGRRGTERPASAKRGTAEDKQHPGGGDKGDDGDEKPPARSGGRRPGAAARRTG